MAALQYLDFDLEIGPGSGGDYPVTVRSPAGEARRIMRFPFDTLVLENYLTKLQNALLRSGGLRRQALLPQEQSVQEFGQRLFAALFAEEVGQRYVVSRERALRQSMGVRLRLRIQAPELAALPWEYLYDPHTADYLCLSRHTPLVRYMELPQPIQPLTVQPPLRILGMLASPRDQATLDEERERERMRRALQDLEARNLVQLTWLSGQTWRDLQTALQGGPWHIFHFIGHGGFDQTADEGVLALANEQGNTQLLHASLLGRLLANHGWVRLVVLNACEGAKGSERDLFSSTAALLVSKGISAVLAMQEEITDLAAIECTRAFYAAVANGLPVDAAVSEARTAISVGITNTLEWGTPVLYLRAPDGVLFEIELIPKPIPKDEPYPDTLPPHKPEPSDGQTRPVIRGPLGPEIKPIPRPKWPEIEPTLEMVVADQGQEPTAPQPKQPEVTGPKKTKEQWLADGDHLRNAGRPDEALAAYDQAIQLDRTYARAYRHKGFLLSQLNKHYKALEALERAILLEPQDVRPYVWKGHALKALGRDDEALAAYNEAITRKQNV